MIGPKTLLSAGLMAAMLSASAIAQESGGDSSAEQIFRVFEALTTDGSANQQEAAEPQKAQTVEPVQAQQVQLKEPQVTIIPATQIRPAPDTLNPQDIDQLSIDKRGIGGGSHADVAAGDILFEVSDDARFDSSAHLLCFGFVEGNNISFHASPRRSNGDDAIGERLGELYHLGVS